ncbi:MAG: amidase, partial [Carnobacterium sp.]
YLLLDVGDYFENHYGFNRIAAEIPEIPIDKETQIPNESAATEDAEITNNGEETKIEPIPDSGNQELSKPNLTLKQQLSANNLVIEETKIDLQKNFPKTSEKVSPTFVLIGSFILMTTSGGLCLKFIMQKKVETSRTGKRNKNYC